jgi:hypothetical protein
MYVCIYVCFGQGSGHISFASCDLVHQEAWLQAKTFVFGLAYLWPLDESSHLYMKRMHYLQMHCIQMAVKIDALMYRWRSWHWAP